DDVREGDEAQELGELDDRSRAELERACNLVVAEIVLVGGVPIEDLADVLLVNADRRSPVRSGHAVESFDEERTVALAISDEARRSDFEAARLGERHEKLLVLDEARKVGRVQLEDITLRSPPAADRRREQRG